MAAPNGSAATTEQVFADDWAGQVARAEKLAADAEAKGEIAQHHLDGGDDEETPAETPAEEAPKPKPAAKKPEAKAKKEGDEEAAADKNEGKVTPDERVNFRREKAKWREKRNEEQAKFDRALHEARGKYGKYEEAEALFAAGDIIAAAEKLAGEKWNELNKKAAKRASGADPRVELLEKRLAEREAAEAKEKAEKAERERVVEYQRNRTEWIGGLKETLSESENEEVAALAGSSLGFLDHVFELQEKDYDPDTGETLTEREAAEQALPHWRSMWADLCKVFGDRPASEDESSGNGAAHRKGSTSAKPGARAPKTLSQRKAAEASPPEPREFDEATWKKRWEKKLRESRADE